MARVDHFSTEVSGKWVLLGEHAVLRGSPALVFPHPAQTLTLRYTKSDSPIEIEPRETKEMILELLSMAIPRIEFESLKGHLEIQSTIISGAGLGSSAALSVCLSRLALSCFSGSEAQPSSDEAIQLATRLEDRFHGKSSGMDIHAVAKGVPLLFSRSEGSIPLELKTFPKFTLHDTGLRTQTRELIEKVEAWRSSHPQYSKEVDQAMEGAVKTAHEALKAFSDKNRVGGESLKSLAQAMRMGRECFKSWGIHPPQIETLENSLLAQGALATKLTGAGGGGFLIALWPESM